MTEGGHDRNKRLAEVKAAQAKAARRRRVPIVIGVVVAVVALAGVAAAVGSHGGGSDSAKHGDGKLATFPTPAPSDTGAEGITPEGGTILAGLTDAAGGNDVDGIQCEASEQVKYHIHSHLAVFVNGAERPVPAGIGIVPPTIQNTPDGPFAGGGARCFYWLHTHTIDGVIHVESPTEAIYTLGQFFALWGQSIDATQVAGEKGAQTIYVDGKPYTGNPADIPLKSREAIQIDVGQDVPFQNVDWSKSSL